MTKRAVKTYYKLPSLTAIKIACFSNDDILKSSLQGIGALLNLEGFDIRPAVSKAYHHAKYVGKVIHYINNVNEICKIQSIRKKWSVSQDFESVLSLFCQYPMHTYMAQTIVFSFFLELGRDDRTICSSQVSQSHTSFLSCDRII